MLFILADIKRKMKQEAAVTSAHSIHDASVSYASGVTAKMVARYRRDLVRPSLDTPSTSLTQKKKNKRKDLLHLLRDGGENKTIGNVLRQINSSVRDIEERYDDNKLPPSLEAKLRADPYINMASVLSKFAKLHSPVYAKATWHRERLNNELLMSTDPTTTALVLPTGHVINLAGCGIKSRPVRL